MERDTCKTLTQVIDTFLFRKIYIGLQVKFH